MIYCGGEFYWWRKPECPEKTTDLVLNNSKKTNYTVSILESAKTKFPIYTETTDLPSDSNNNVDVYLSSHDVFLK
jgi:hypothetical protein